MQKFVKTKRDNHKKFLCALCATPRKMKYKKDLSLRNYLQITLLAGSISFALWPLISFHSIVVLPLLWCAVEFTNKLLYRKELPCPHCGFDATWYKRDIKIARTKVENFWSSKSQKNYKVDEKSDLEELLN